MPKPSRRSTPRLKPRQSARRCPDCHRLVRIGAARCGSCGAALLAGAPAAAHPPPARPAASSRAHGYQAATKMLADDASAARRLPTRCPQCNRLVRLGATACRLCGFLLVRPYTPLEPGQSLAQGRFSVQRALTRGAMGALYLATDHEAFDRTVVIKALLDTPDLTNQQEVQAARQRFDQEARTLSTLKHPTIPQIFTYFQDGAHNYIVMEYIEGTDLEQHLTSKDEDSGAIQHGSAYPLQDVLRWGITLCHTLEYLASRQPHPVIHHDIKPANLVLDRNSQSIRLVDFGTAKVRVLLQPDGSVGIQKSSTFGTQGYAPPEQYRGQSNPRSDVYALAATLYHLATDDDPGEHPFAFPRLAALGRFGSVLEAALHNDNSMRPSATELRLRLEALLAPEGARTIQAPDGTALLNELELAAWCERNWARGVFWLYNRLPEQVEVVWGKTRLADDMRRLMHQHDNDRNAGLDAVLALLDPQGFGAEEPRLRATQPALDFGAVAVGARSSQPLLLVNPGRRYVCARLQMPAWLAAERASVGILPRQQTSITLSTSMQRAPFGGTFSDTLQLSHDTTPLARVQVAAYVSRWNTLWKRYPLQTVALLLLLLLGLSLSSFWFYQQRQLDAHYEAGAAALQRGDWQAARHELAQVQAMQQGYQDSSVLLLESYYRPALAALERGDWQAARRDFAQVLALQPDYRDADTLLQESYYRPGQAALERGAWSEARAALGQIGGYRDADTLLQESYYRPGQAALERGAWNEARAALGQIAGYRDADTLLKESYYRAGQAAMQRGAWGEARSQFNQLFALQQGYRDADTLLQESYYRAGQAALEQGDWVAARAELLQIDDYRDASTLLKETYYQPALRAIEAQRWSEAAHALLELDALDAAYRDVPLLMAAHPELLRALAQQHARAWQNGQASEARTLSGHTNNVHSVAFAPGGQLLASGGWDNMVRLWQVEDGALLWSFEGHEKYVSGVAFSPDGQLLASASADQAIKLWQVPNKALLRTLNGHSSYVSGVAFSPDGQLLASGSWDTTARIWRVEDGTQVHVLRAHEGVVESVAFSPDGQMLASGSWDNTVHVWRVEDGALLHTLPGHTWHVSSVAFSPDGRLLASASWDKTIKLWRVEDGALLHTLNGHQDDVRAVSFSPDGQLLASGSGGLLGRDTSVKLWRVEDGTLLHTLSGHSGWVHSVAFSPDGRLLASGSFDHTVKLWQAEE